MYYLSENTRTSEVLSTYNKVSTTKLREFKHKDCLVEYKKVSMARGRDGKEYDISTLDDKLCAFIDIKQARTEECIVIDWT
jgi:hypothetical protein